VGTRPYAIVTPAKNEERVVEHTLRSMVSQTVKPQKWVIVSDGSTDRTDEIVQSYADRYSFIELLRSPRTERRNFGSKVAAFNAGYQRLAAIDYEFIGNLDADVSFVPDYFETLLGRFERNPKLGVGGGIIIELVEGKFVSQSISDNSVAGAVQLFRRECFESIGGYLPLSGGGIDAAAEIMARHHGWQVKTFSDLSVHHHRRVTSGSGSVLSTESRLGRTAYRLGYHPAFALAISASRIFERPYVVKAAAHAVGYLLARLRREKIQIPDDSVRFLRAEQLARLKDLFLQGRSRKVVCSPDIKGSAESHT
jgi:glycosyltransferase involved in cell wall biosynthesis